MILLDESSHRLDENALNVVLDILGFIPGIGEAADFTNVMIFLKRSQTSDDPSTDYLFAALSLVAMIPVIGDVVGKGGKILVGAARGGKLAKSSPLLLKTQRAIVKAGPEIEKVMTALAGKSNAFKPYAKRMRDALTEFAKEPAIAPIQESRLRISRLLDCR